MNMKPLTAGALSLALACPLAWAEKGDPLVVTPLESQSAVQGPDDKFTGSVRVDSRFSTQEPARVSGGTVTFEPDARTAWHTHPLGQTLIVTSGIGRVQSWGDPVQTVKAGDSVWIPPNVKHWHGAAPETAMTHVAIAEKKDGTVVEWLEKVSDEQYQP